MTLYRQGAFVISMQGFSVAKSYKVKWLFHFCIHLKRFLILHHQQLMKQFEATEKIHGKNKIALSEVEMFSHKWILINSSDCALKLYR